jgi:hypothetical protein
MDFNSLETLVNLKGLRAAGISNNQIEGLDMLLLPENADSSSDELYDAQDTITLSKVLKSEGVKCANSYDLGLDISTKERRSNDIWLGHLFVFNDAILPILTGAISGILSPLIFDWMKRKDKREPAGIVHVEITVIKDGEKTELRYDGAPEGFVKILKTLEKPTDDA